jgi:mitochondrial fission 1 protein
LLARRIPERELDCYYYLAIGYYKLANYFEAKKYNDALLEKQPTNKQALVLASLTRYKLKRDGLIGMGMVAAAGTVLVGGLAYLLRRK